MFRMTWGQLRHRGGRSVALLLAILVAATGFTVLTASSNASELSTVGTIEEHAATSYDILVRPAGSRSSLEQSQSLVQPGFLSGIYGGISLAQWHKIESLSGIDVAAPIAMVGYVVLPLELPVDMHAGLPRSGGGVARMDVSWSYDNGLSTVAQSPQFAYLTSDRLSFNTTGNALTQGVWRVGSDSPDAPTVCRHNFPFEPGTPVSQLATTLLCFSRTQGGDGTLLTNWPRGVAGQELAFPLPMVLAAVDPTQENKLDGLDGAITSGTPLQGAPLTDSRTMSGHAVPVLAADQPTTGVTASVSVSTVSAGGVALVKELAPSASLRTQPYQVVSRRQVTAGQVYQTLLAQLKNPQPNVQSSSDDGLAGNVYWYASVSNPQLSADGHVVQTARPPGYVKDQYATEDPAAVPGANDTPVRNVTESDISSEAGEWPRPATLISRGTFDPAKLTGLSDLTGQILAGYGTVATTGADARSQQALGGKPLAPSPNIAGLVQAPPMLLTSLDALPQMMAGFEPNTAAAPISAIRVRVAGVHGVDALSRERVRVAAQRISQATGLDVDITVGSSPSQRTVNLPAGRFGRPELLLSQPWVKKGVAITILTALDKKSLILFVLVLLVCALSVANTSVASVRARRGELGVLACLGWRRKHLFTTVLSELAVVAIAAGIIAAGMSVAIGAAIGTPISWPRAALALPAAVAVALLAGSVPAWLATRADPMDAVQPALTGPRRPGAATSVARLGLTNLRRARVRALIAAGGLLVAVAVFTMLAAITVAFQGIVAGSVLGDAVAVQVRSADIAAAIATLVLAGLGVANVLYLNIRDRGAEIATLRAIGWRERHLSRLVLVEGLGIAVIGTIPGAVIGLAGAAALAGSMQTGILVAALVAAAVGVLVATVASLVPIRLLRRLPTAVLLTEE